MPTTPHRGGQDASGDSSTMNSPGNIFQTGNDAQSRPNHPNRVTFATTDPVSSSANTAIPPTRNAQGNQIQQMTPAATSSSPLRSHRSPGSPRIGRHSTHHASSSSPRRAQAAPKSTGARDVWTFYKKVGLTRECIFCQVKRNASPVDNDSDDALPVKFFALGTGTSPLRKHLAKEHLGEWVDACDKFKIPITISSLQEVVNAHRQKKGRATTDAHSGQPPSHQTSFSPEAFLDAITEFIVADDQVSLSVQS
ncbi:hypothetical protein BJ165DRAFT_631958 [Panaeolus papilionaceus]|nr:hypothetical protein BJ165DRAFT_631958 [Panaeolus papilionaceus]